MKTIVRVSPEQMRQAIHPRQVRDLVEAGGIDMSRKVVFHYDPLTGDGIYEQDSPLPGDIMATLLPVIKKMEKLND